MQQDDSRPGPWLLQQLSLRPTHVHGKKGLAWQICTTGCFQKPHLA